MAIRITGGTFRGRQIASPLTSKTRPTGAMAREALFNILQNVEGFHVLDLFAGSGCVGKRDGCRKKRRAGALSGYVL